ncbi:hypothetical protein [Methylobacterium sp. ID0610]|uniref:hypothetical protein n=1 Tax=Methylobacterium carpenticola TaxID=3344827 RepID=UPI00369B4651
MSTLKIKSLIAPAGAIVVQIGKNACVARTDALPRRIAKATAAHTRALIMSGEHRDEAKRDLGFVVACELVETMFALDGARGDAAKVARLNDEGQRFAISLQQYEKHPFVFVHHDRVAMTTNIVPMKDLKTLADFNAWEKGLNSVHGGLLGLQGAML